MKDKKMVSVIFLDIVTRKSIMVKIFTLPMYLN